MTKNVLATPKTVPCGPNGHCGTLARPLVAAEENQEIENVVDEVRIILRFHSKVNHRDSRTGTIVPVFYSLVPKQILKFLD